jgi:protein involved in sex pheromone biosynthesis
MNKKFAILFLIPVMLLTGCSNTSTREKQVEKDWDVEELFAKMEREEEQKLKPICDQEMIPAEYASVCYFRELKKCDKFSGEMIPKVELEKCMPYFLKEEIENISY